MTALVFSVHADDAVFSCGEWIANQVANGEKVVVASLCSAVPDWVDDAGREWQAELNREHMAACLSLGAEPFFVGYVDGKWAKPEDRHIQAAPNGGLDDGRMSTVLIPLGIHHPDHLFFSHLLMEAARLNPGPRVAIYEDLPYRVLYPEAALDRRSEVLYPLGVRELESAACSGFLEEKLRACRLYASQWSPPEGDAPRCCSAPERTWWIS